MITDCETTVNEIINTVFPCRDLSISKKNRLIDPMDILKRNWTIGHFYIEIDAGCHHCIFKRAVNTMEITDSFINYRSKENRLFPYTDFEYLFTSIFSLSTNIAERKLCYEILFKPPPSYIEHWNGTIKKVYLDQLD